MTVLPYKKHVYVNYIQFKLSTWNFNRMTKVQIHKSGAKIFYNAFTYTKLQ